nr:MAG TPA: hypothetical protein [Caudoviricetes sp.]
MVELAETDLDKYHFVFKRDISKIKSVYYHAYYHKKQDANSDDLLPFRATIISSKFAFTCVILR